jgi:hypothetical protein
LEPADRGVIQFLFPVKPIFDTAKI